MSNITRIIIFLILMGLLYFFYKYQQSNKPKKKNIEPYNNTKKDPQLIDQESSSIVDIDNISQLSLGSLEDFSTETTNGNIYKQDSMLNSTISNEEAESSYI